MNNNIEDTISDKLFEPKNQYKYLEKQYEENSIDIYLTLLPNNLLFAIQDWILTDGQKELIKAKNKSLQKNELDKLNKVSECITNELINRRLEKVKKLKK